jgi:hypothetical protein
MAGTNRDDRNDTDDEFLKDHHRGRVSMMRDGQPRWVADADRYFGERAADSRVIGIDGMPESLHRPGYRFGDANKANLDERQRAYEDYQQSLQDAWKGDRKG